MGLLGNSIGDDSDGQKDERAPIESLPSAQGLESVLSFGLILV